MAQKTRQELKDTFVNGYKPTENDFADLLDSYLQLSEVDKINKQITGNGGVYILSDDDKKFDIEFSVSGNTILRIDVGVLNEGFETTIFDSNEQGQIFFTTGTGVDLLYNHNYLPQTEMFSASTISVVTIKKLSNASNGDERYVIYGNLEKVPEFVDDSLYHWNCEDGSGNTIMDIKNGNNATAVGLTFMAGVKNGGVFIDPTVQPALTNPISPIGEFALSVWYYPNTQSQYKTLFGMQNNQHAMLLSNNSENRLMAYNSGFKFINLEPGKSDILSVGNWYHIVYNYSSDGFFKVYVNGEYIGVSQESINHDFISQPITHIGNSGTQAYGVGLMDEVRYYDRNLLDYEIQFMYNQLI
ncbi:LamG domain-containing protein [Nonlabens xiamenensis]|uniref:LamG domain-containing protein n=1 Tax=Nonlabens xiamenensis TaxID=2341043 RepID=UPI000F613967|nr:LamG domain-containing protein [Nonlabens xiamenensis]